jgi:spore coat polysaccharide biosynthesis predicted glycosyltransferase SpsG
LIFCNGGVTLYEANCIGAPSVVLHQNREEYGTALTFSKHGSSILLGKPSVSRIKRILSLSQSKRRKMSDIGKRLVDGRGLERVTQIALFTLVNVINEKKKGL